MRFKLLLGRHVQSNAEGESETFDANDPHRNIVESERDLAREFGREKFRPLPDEEE